MSTNLPRLKTSGNAPRERAHCDNCRWHSDTADCADEAQAHAIRSGHVTVVALIGSTRYVPIVNAEAEPS